MTRFVLVANSYIISFARAGWVGAVQAYRYAPRPKIRVREAKSTFSIRDNFTQRNYAQNSRDQSLDTPVESSSKVTDIPFTSREEKNIESFRMSILAVNDKEELRRLDERKADSDRIRQERSNFQRSRYTNEKYATKKPEGADGDVGASDDRGGEPVGNDGADEAKANQSKK